MCAVFHRAAPEQPPAVNALLLLCQHFHVVDASPEASCSARSAAWLQLSAHEKAMMNASAATDLSNGNERTVDVRLGDDNPVAKYAASHHVLSCFAAATSPPKSVETYFSRVLTYGGPAVRGCVDIATLLLLRLRAKILLERFAAKRHSVVLLEGEDCLCEDEKLPLLEVDSWFVLPNQVICRLAVAALLIAGKMHHDVFPSTKHLAGVWGLSRCADLIRYETLLLQLLNFDVHITPEEYHAFQRLVMHSGNVAVVQSCKGLVTTGQTCADSRATCSAHDANFFLRFSMKRFASDGSVATMEDLIDDDPFISGTASSVHTPRV